MQLFELKGIVFRERERAQKENTMVSGEWGGDPWKNTRGEHARSIVLEISPWESNKSLQHP